MTCKYCLYFEVCKNLDGVFAGSFTSRNNIEKHCEHFKDRSKIIDLPCAVVDMVYFIKTAFSYLPVPKAEKI